MEAGEEAEWTEEREGGGGEDGERTGRGAGTGERSEKTVGGGGGSGQDRSGPGDVLPAPSIGLSPC